MAAKPVLFVEGVPRSLDFGTTLKDIRVSFPGSYLRDHLGVDDHMIDGFLLEEGKAYDLVQPKFRKETDVPLPPPPSEDIANTPLSSLSPRSSLAARASTSSPRTNIAPPPVFKRPIDQSVIENLKSAVTSSLETPHSDVATGKAYKNHSKKERAHVSSSTAAVVSSETADAEPEESKKLAIPALSFQSIQSNGPSSSLVSHVTHDIDVDTRAVAPSMPPPPPPIMQRTPSIDEDIPPPPPGAPPASDGEEVRHWNNVMLSPRSGAQGAHNVPSEFFVPHGQFSGSPRGSAVSPRGAPVSPREAKEDEEVAAMAAQAGFSLSPESLAVARPKPRLLVVVLRYKFEKHEGSLISTQPVHVEYFFRVKDEDLKMTYHMCKRYSDFYELKKNIEKNFPEQSIRLAEFPPKKIFGNQEEETIKERIKMLNIWLFSILQVPSIYSSSTFLDFLEYHAEVSKHEKLSWPSMPEKKNDDPNRIVLEIVKWRETGSLDFDKVHVEYQLRVQVGDLSWRIEHRFSEFLDLHKFFEELMKNKLDELPKFPPKKMFKELDSEFVKKRMVELQAWLNAILLIPVLVTSRDFKEFIDPSGIMMRALQIEKKRKAAAKAAASSGNTAQ